MTHAAHMLVDYVQGFNLSPEIARSLSLQAGMRFCVEDSWRAALDRLTFAEDDVVYYHQSSDGEVVCLGGDTGGVVIYLRLSRDKVVYADCLAHTLGDANRAMADLRSSFPEAQRFNDDKTIPLSLWTLTHNGPRQIRRTIDVPAWSDVRQNYAHDVVEQVEDLMLVRPTSGKIILWSGPAGTGKTYAIRALAYEWRTWVDVHYVVDPEVLLGNEPAYLMDVLLAEGDGLKEGSAIGEEDRWRLFVLEDAGELLTVDAREKVGQALSRLLNAAEGILGQGMRFLFLITTNEDLGRVHPAVARPGRCAAQIKFCPFSSDQATEWLVAHEAPVYPAPNSPTLAELYARLTGQHKLDKPPAVGFRRSG